MRALVLLVGLVFSACPNAPTGTRCAQHSDCRSLPEGYCSRAEVCTRVCDAAPCPDGYRCSTEGARRVCVGACESDMNCFDGFVCQEGSDGKVCRLAKPLDQLPAQ